LNGLIEVPADLAARTAWSARNSRKAERQVYKVVGTRFLNQPWSERAKVAVGVGKPVVFLKFEI